MKTELLSQWYIKVAGQNVSEEIMDDVISIEVDNSLHLPDMFSIHLRDQLDSSGSYKWMDGNTFGLGKEVIISADPKGEEEKPFSHFQGLKPNFNHPQIWRHEILDNSHKFCGCFRQGASYCTCQRTPHRVNALEI